MLSTRSITCWRKRLARGQAHRGGCNQCARGGPQAADRTRAAIPLLRRCHCAERSEKTCLERNQNRPERTFGPHVVRRQLADLKRGTARAWSGRGSATFTSCEDEIASDQVEIRRVPLWNNKKDQAGPFDIFGDLHGCADELRALLTQLGWERYAMEEPDSPWGGECWRHPAGRRAIFLGDLVDRGPRCSTPFGLRGIWSRPAPRFASPGTTM